MAILAKESAAGSDRRTAVNKHRRVGCVNKSAPRAFADERADLAELEHIRHQVAARAGHFVDDHYLWPPDAGRRRSERIAVARDVVKVTVKISLQNVDDVIGRRAAAVVAFVDDRAFFVLLRKVIAVKARIAGLAGIRQINVGELSAGEFVDETTILFDPRACAKRLFAADRHDRVRTRSVERRLVVDRDLDLSVRRAVEQAIDVVGAL